MDAPYDVFLGTKRILDAVPAETVCFYAVLWRSQVVFLLFLPLIALSCSGCDPGQEKAVPAKEPGLSAREAFAVAWPGAQRWDTDARLCWVTGTLDDDGRCPLVFHCGRRRQDL